MKVGSGFTKFIVSCSVVSLSFISLFADPNGIKTAGMPEPLDPGVKGADLSMAASYTLWTARQDGLGVAIANFFLPGSTLPKHSNVDYPPWKWRSGFKAEVGVYLPHDDWDIQAEYTWFSNRDNHFNSAEFAPMHALSTWFPIVLDGIMRLDAASSKWNNVFNRIDLQLGKNWYIGRFTTLKPIIGMLGAWDREWFYINYVESILPIEFPIKNKQNSWAVGPYFGINSTYCMPSFSNTSQLSVFLDAGFSLPWSQFTTSQLISRGNDVLIDYKNKVRIVAPMIDMSLGARYEIWWSLDSWNFLIQAAWEQQVWFDHNHFFVAGSQRTFQGGNFSLQGLTAKVQIGF